jgi:WD repeat-containing protein 19
VHTCWSNDLLLALATVDNLVSLSNSDGDTLKTVQLRGKPTDLKFGQIKEDKSVPYTDNCVSFGKSLSYM